MVYGIVLACQTTECGVQMEEKEGRALAGEKSGIQYGNRISSETTSGMEKFHARQGHGFAAERADHLHDYLDGKNVKILGDDNAANGADRMVDGRMIQSKYCSSGSTCVAECFSEGHFRYYTKSGKPMQIEVPSDMYEAAVKSMERRIQHGEVDGVTDPKAARKMIRRGAYTYEEAKAIAQTGTIESLTFDAENGAIIAANAVGVSAILSLAVSIWNGDDVDTAIKRAVLSGLKVGGVTFLSTILASQITRAGITAELRIGTDYFVKIAGPRVSGYIANGLKTGDSIYGAAAMNNVSKLLRNNIITGAITVVVLSGKDIMDLFNGKMSGGQLFKNVTVTSGAVAGGAAGWAGGTIAGAAAGSFIPIVGTAAGAFLGGIAGSLAGGSAGGAVTRAVLDTAIEDDAKKMLGIIERELQEVLEHVFLTTNEAELLLETIKEDIDYEALKEMYASGSYAKWAHEFIQERMDDILYSRDFIELPDADMWVDGMRSVLEAVIDGKDVFSNTGGCQPMFLAQKSGLLEKYHIRKTQIPKIMRPVKKMNHVLIRTEKVLQKMQFDEKKYNLAHDHILEERAQIKEEINSIIKRGKQHEK